MSNDTKKTDEKAAASPVAEADPSNGLPHSRTLRILIQIIVMGSAIFLAATGAYAVKNSGAETNIDDRTGLVFVALYLILFSSILFTYEMIQIRPCEAVDNYYKKNFGFLYGPTGKGFYMVL